MCGCVSVSAGGRSALSSRRSARVSARGWEGRAGPSHLAFPSASRSRHRPWPPAPGAAQPGARLSPRRGPGRRAPPRCGEGEGGVTAVLRVRGTGSPGKAAGGARARFGRAACYPPRPAASGAWLAPPRFFCRARRSRWPRRSRVWSDLRAGALGKAVPACRGAVGGESRPRGNDRGPAGSRSLRRAGRGEVVWVRALLR